MATPKEIMETWPIYHVASQNTEHCDLKVRKLRCPNDKQMFELLDRLTGRPWDQLKFLEIHKHSPDSKETEVIHGSGDSEYPTGAKVVQEYGLITPKIPTEEPKVALLPAPAIAPNIAKPNSPTPEKITEVVGQLVRAAQDAVTLKPFTPTESFRPFRNYIIQDA